jgi:Rrf2 family cysteine metabolism transcriptional repressor
MNISVKGEYALKAILDLAYRGGAGPVKIADIAGRQRIPQKFLELILAQLKQGGFVESRRGAEGGYLLARPADSIMVGEVLRFMDGPLSPAEQGRAIRGAATSRRRVRTFESETPFSEMWQQVDAAVSGVVDHTSFADLVTRWAEKSSQFVANWQI